MNGIVAIVGRPNVGKSTLFNRLIEKKDAIVDSESGVTRDRNYGKCDWNGKEFSIIDTGGYLVGGNDIFEKQIDKQVELAIDECDLIIFLVDVESGLIGMDQEVSKLLYKSKKPFFLAVNKVDNSYRQNQIHEFYQIGVDKIYPISAINGSGTGDLLDDLVIKLPTIQNENQQNLPKFAVVGRPNAGKSSYINSLIGETRYIVTDIPGTTRDSIDTKYNLYGFEFILIDTAGIRKKSKVKENIEFYSVMRSIRSIERSDVCFLIFDATREFDSQVQNIFWLAEKNNKGIVILVNKWDLVKKSTRTIDDFINKIKKRIEPFDDVPIIFISSINKQRIHKAIEKGIHVFKNRVKKIITRDLNTDLLEVINNTPPPSIKGKSINIKFCTQLPGPYPQFAFFCNLPQYIKENYRRFLENKIRDIYDFQGCPINIYFRKK
ncbi:MAG: ribosome biogenesis GTPase Der [Bacteroidota bacterium]|nr:ribosome biogenesis GTPase Der [Bacteroidota bacterium]|tara:strand:- start:27 stop:1331 length:1305 start_codon:yes stop_codon:yes gene_type:complete